MNRKSFLKTLIGGVVSAPIAVHELQSQAIPKLQPDGYKDSLKPIQISGCVIDIPRLVLYPTETIAIGTVTPSHKLIVN